MSGMCADDYDEQVSFHITAKQRKIKISFLFYPFFSPKFLQIKTFIIGSKLVGSWMVFLYFANLHVLV